jgi:hypothetical protein
VAQAGSMVIAGRACAASVGRFDGYHQARRRTCLRWVTPHKSPAGNRLVPANPPYGIKSDFELAELEADGAVTGTPVTTRLAK